MVASGILAVAGETSGDLLAATILKKCLPENSHLFGVGGTNLQNLGMSLWQDCHALAVRGYVEALPALKRVLTIRKQLITALKYHPPKLYLAIDAADFNLHIEQYVNKQTTKIVHLISPSIWAWRFNRIYKMQNTIDCMLCIFPFEPKIYQAHNIRAHFIGHPLAQSIAHHSLNNIWHMQQQRQINKILALVPGSRIAEIKTLLGKFLESALQLWLEGAINTVHIPVASDYLKPYINFELQQFTNCFKRQQQFGMQKLNKFIQAIHLKNTMKDALENSFFAIVASGTASLEVALYQVPMLIAYQVPKLTAYLTKRKALINCVGLPNILYQRYFNETDLQVPELLQDACNVNHLVQTSKKLLSDSGQTGLQFKQIEIFNHLHQWLIHGEQADTLLKEFL